MNIGGLKYKVRLRIYRDDLVFGPGVAQLLEKIEETGSMSEACRLMEMSYSKAWRILKRSQDDLGFLLVSGRHGGKNGGSMTLTEEGKDFLRRYRSMEKDMHAAIDELMKQYFGE